MSVLGCILLKHNKGWLERLQVKLIEEDVV
jgi:hypothetical protein